MKRLAALFALLYLPAIAAAQSVDRRDEPLVIASKPFTESVVLGEIVRLTLEGAGSTVRHDRAAGGTRILYGGLRRGDIDLYPEYSGTILFEIFAGQGVGDLSDLRRRLAEDGLRMSAPLGFDNSYALAMARDRAAALGIESISDLARHPGLVFGFSNEFMDRADGWGALRRAYGLDARANGLQHDLAYRGLAAGRLDVTDAYVTDAEIAYYDLRILEDDRDFFPDYQAVFLYRAELENRAPAAIAALERVAGRIDAAAMRAMNKAVKIDGRAEAAVGADFLRDALGLQRAAEQPPSLRERIQRRTLEHLGLVAVSLSAAILIAVPLGIAAQRRRRLGAILLGAVGLLQTIPALALFVFMIPVLGIGAEPTVAALFLYSLLPIVRNTHAGFAGIDSDLRESALALGLSPRARLLRIELPLALPTMLAGVKTAAVINVGLATLGALIGAGGLGQPILTGIRLDDIGLILEGAIPAALLALLVTGLFDAVERAVTPRGLRLEPASR